MSLPAVDSGEAAKDFSRKFDLELEEKLK